MPTEASADLAAKWLEYVFRGAALPADLPSRAAFGLENVAAALRQSLSAYSVAVLVLAGAVLLYQVAAMVAETAHQGVPLGRRVNRLWTPIRFVLAFCLLVPISGGLNAGQYLMVELASSGSSLASGIWGKAAQTMPGGFFSNPQPRSPDPSRLVATALEMEICRTVYRKHFAALSPYDAFAQLAGNISETSKIPSPKFGDETWRYSNFLNREAPLCGEYRFSGGGMNGSPAAELAAFSRADAERLILKARAVAEQVSGALSLSPPQAPSADARSAIASVLEEQRQTIAAKIEGLAKGDRNLANAALGESASQGWVAGGLLFLEIMKTQSVHAAIAANLLPKTQAPVFGHWKTAQETLNDALEESFAFRGIPSAQAESIRAVYEKTSAGMEEARIWLYGGQMAGAAVPPDQFDLRDRAGKTADFDGVFSALSQSLNRAATAEGIWNNGNAAAKTAGQSSEESFSPLWLGAKTNPISALAEAGWRYFNLGSYLFGMAGEAFGGDSVGGSAGAAILFSLLAAAFVLCGIALAAVLPLLPFLRFAKGIIVWLVEVFAAVIAMPLVALLHLTVSGDGIGGDAARRAYWLWFGVFARPALTVLGLICGIIAMGLAVPLLEWLFSSVNAAIQGYEGGAFTSARAVLALAFAASVYAIVNVIFRAACAMPEGFMRWVGEGFSSLSGGEAAPYPTAATGGGNGGSASSLPTPSASGEARFSAGNGVVSRQSSAGAGTAAAANPHRLKSSLFPSYSPDSKGADTAAESLHKTNVNAASAASGAQGSSTASSSGGNATASANATAAATARVEIAAAPKTLPVVNETDRKEEPPDIAKAVERLAEMVEKNSKNRDEKKKDGEE